LLFMSVVVQDKPYSCKSGFYTRIGPNAQKMNRNQIIDFFQSEGQIRFEELTNLKFKYEKDFDPNKLLHFLKLAGITCALYKGVEKNDVLDRKDFNKDIISNVDNTLLFLRQHIPVKYEFDGSPGRIEIPQIPLEALREAVINAPAIGIILKRGECNGRNFR
jgi:ATP-dependent DNA helicase RecG